MSESGRMGRNRQGGALRLRRFDCAHHRSGSPLRYERKEQNTQDSDPRLERVSAYFSRLRGPAGENRLVHATNWRTIETVPINTVPRL
jgi:hypothetical protein